MKKYSPLLPVAIFGVLLLLPIGVLALALSLPPAAEPPAVVSAEADPQVLEQLGQLSQRLNALETQVEEIRVAQSQQPPTEPQLAVDIVERASPIALAFPPVLADQTTTPSQPAPLKNTVASAAAAKPRPSLSLGQVGTWLKQLLPEPPATPLIAVTEQTQKARRTTEQDRSKPSDPKAEVLTDEPPLASSETGTKTPKVEEIADKPPTLSSRTRPKTSNKTSRKKLSKTKEPAEDAMPVEDVAAVEPFGGGDLAAVEPMIDVRVSRPEPGNVVGRWENLIATTPEAGWPVVLVRSEAKGDSWWVQQVVTRRGNVIAARVNFGNIETISAHGFEMVVLLLENSAQSVRFRTAREFKTIPPGVRRSKIFRYVRG